jgi:26S proteasome regulatory subunit N9
LRCVHAFLQLLHPILASLDGTPHAYLSTLLNSFNSGSIGSFESLIPNLSAEPILAENQPFLRQKICLMALIESVFRRNADERTLPFATIAQETRLPEGEVEHLVMKALRCVHLLCCARRAAADRRSTPAA